MQLATWRVSVSTDEQGWYTVDAESGDTGFTFRSPHLSQAMNDAMLFVESEVLNRQSAAEASGRG
jgi:hypothetical protein